MANTKKTLLFLNAVLLKMSRGISLIEESSLETASDYLIHLRNPLHLDVVRV
jgi:hypothetical protein